MKLTQFSLTIAAVFLTAQASAATPKLGVVYDAGGKFDKSFNQSAFEGASRFKKDTGISFIEVQASSDTQAEQVMRGLARKKLDMIAAIGFAQTQAVQKVAKEFPNVKFVLIDGRLPAATSIPSSSRKKKALIWWAWLQPWPARARRSASSAASISP